MEERFKFHIESQYNPLSLRLRRETVIFRIKIMRDVFVKIEDLHRASGARPGISPAAI